MKTNLDKTEDYENKVFQKIMDIHAEEESKEILRNMAEHPDNKPELSFDEFMKKVEARQAAQEEKK